MDNAQRITTVSRKLRLVCIGLIFLQPIACGLFWIFFNRLYAIAPMVALPVHIDHNLSAVTRFLAFLSGLLPLGAVLYGLKRLKDLFALYEKGRIFTGENVACFRSLGRTLIVWSVCEVLRTSLLSIVLTLPNPPGHRMFTLGFDSAELAALFVGIVVAIISWVMDEARKIQEDQCLII